MKKLIPFACTFVYSLFGGLFINSAFYALSYTLYRWRHFLFFAALALLAALFIAVMGVINAAYLTNLNDRRKARKTIALQILFFIIPFFLFWASWEHFFDNYIPDIILSLKKLLL